MKKLNDKAQGSTFLYFFLFLMVMMLMTLTGIGQILGYYFGLVLQPLIGFDGKYPMMTLFLAGVIVVFLSSLLTNFFTDWKKMGESQEISRAFQKELSKARKEGNTKRVNKLMKMQPEIFKRQQEASGGMMKPMVFLIIFIFPIFIWLRYFLTFEMPHYYFTVPWAQQVSLFSKPILWQSWLWIYLIASFIIGQIFRNGLKYIGWTEQWKNIRKKIIPSRN